MRTYRPSLLSKDKISRNIVELVEAVSSKKTKKNQPYAIQSCIWFSYMSCKVYFAEYIHCYCSDNQNSIESSLEILLSEGDESIENPQKTKTSSDYLLIRSLEKRE